MTHSSVNHAPASISADVIVVGGGFGGCYALHELRKAGYNVKLIEAGSDFGGVWHFNKYPGARVDSELPLYQLSLPEAWRSFNFTERFPGHVELRQYFANLAETLDLRKDAIFNSRVIGAQWNSDSSTWTFQTENGLTATARYAIFATGTTNKPFIPNFPGLENFSGTVLHPCRWPDSLDLKGKKIGIVGQGASGLQILQELAKEEAGVTVFIRNPPTALPMEQRTLSREDSEQQKCSYIPLFDHAKYRDDSAYAYNACPHSFSQSTPEERQRYYEELWARGSYSILTSNYPEHNYDKDANAELYQFWAKSVRARITDPTKRDIMAPLQQFQWIGTKRPNLEMDYYEKIDQPNVKLVDLKKQAIKCFTETGIVTTGEHSEVTHDLDIVVMATGYDSVTGSLYEMNILDKNSITLQQKWKASIQTYLGMLAPGLPNMIMLYGPQAPSGLANGPPFLELQVDWLVKFLKKLQAQSFTTFEVKLEAARAYVQRNLDGYDQSLMKETSSWWNGSNVPGKTKEPLFWVLGLQEWRKETETCLENLPHYLELR